jgi:hypothetical protein
VLAAVWLVAASGAACSSSGLEHGAPSADALARDVLEALAGRDLVRLRELSVSEGEFRAVVWPELPAARPERNLPVDYVWGDLRGKSEAGLRRIVTASGGRGYALVRLRYAGGTTPYCSYLIHREASVTVRDADGREETLRLFGSILERNGRFKVFSYVVD